MSWHAQSRHETSGSGSRSMACRWRGFSELVMGAGAEHLAGHPRGADAPLLAKRRAGLVKARNVTLKAGTTSSLQLSTWSAQAAAGPLPGSRQNVVIVEVDEQGD